MSMRDRESFDCTGFTEIFLVAFAIAGLIALATFGSATFIELMLR